MFRGFFRDSVRKGVRVQATQEFVDGLVVFMPEGWFCGSKQLVMEGQERP